MVLRRPVSRHRGGAGNAGGRGRARGGRLDRHRPVQPVRLRRARSSPCRASRRDSQTARSRGVPVVAVSGIIGGQRTQGSRRPDAGFARPRVERARRRAPVHGDRRRVRARYRRRVARARDSQARACGRSSRTRSWPTTRAGPGSRAMSSRQRARADPPVPTAPPGTMSGVELRAPSDLSSTWAVVPIRGLATAKSRLGVDLDARHVWPSSRSCCAGRWSRPAMRGASRARSSSPWIRTRPGSPSAMARSGSSSARRD